MIDLRLNIENPRSSRIRFIGSALLLIVGGWMSANAQAKDVVQLPIKDEADFSSQSVQCESTHQSLTSVEQRLEDSNTEALQILKGWIALKLNRDDFNGLGEGLVDYERRLNKLIQRGHADEMSLFLYQGWLAQVEGDWDEAKQHFMKAFNLNEQFHFNAGQEVAWLSERMVILFIEIGFYDAVEEISRGSLRIWKESWGTRFPHFC